MDEQLNKILAEIQMEINRSTDKKEIKGLKKALHIVNSYRAFEEITLEDDLREESNGELQAKWEIVERKFKNVVGVFDGEGMTSVIELADALEKERATRFVVVKKFDKVGAKTPIVVDKITYPLFDKATPDLVSEWIRKKISKGFLGAERFNIWLYSSKAKVGDVFPLNGGEVEVIRA